MLTKIVIVVAMLLIASTLCSGLIALIRGKDSRSVKALTWRISLSAVLFIFLFFAFKFHWIAPHGL